MNKKGIESETLIKIIWVIIFGAIVVAIIIGMLKRAGIT